MYFVRDLRRGDSRRRFLHLRVPRRHCALLLYHPPYVSLPLSSRIAAHRLVVIAGADRQ